MEGHVIITQGEAQHLSLGIHALANGLNVLFGYEEFDEECEDDSGSTVNFSTHEFPTYESLTDERPAMTATPYLTRQRVPTLIRRMNARPRTSARARIVVISNPFCFYNMV